MNMARKRWLDVLEMRHNPSHSFRMVCFKCILCAKIRGIRSYLEAFVSTKFLLRIFPMGGSQFAISTFTRMIQKKIIPSLQFFQSKEFFDL